MVLLIKEEESRSKTKTVMSSPNSYLTGINEHSTCSKHDLSIINAKLETPLTGILKYSQCNNLVTQNMHTKNIRTM